MALSESSSSIHKDWWPIRKSLKNNATTIIAVISAHPPTLFRASLMKTVIIHNDQFFQTKAQPKKNKKELC